MSGSADLGDHHRRVSVIAIAVPRTRQLNQVVPWSHRRSFTWNNALWGIEDFRTPAG
jgi:hypothetical protein